MFIFEMNLLGYPVQFVVALVDPVLLVLVSISVAIVLTALLCKVLRQPYVVAYIIVGIILGPQVLAIITDEDLITNLGSFGLVLLMFFIGMDVSLPKLIANWKIPIIGTFIQVIVSIGAIAAVGFLVAWEINQIIVLGFVISLSSSAIIINYMQTNGELESLVGKNLIGILLVQDVLVVPMLIIINYLSGSAPSFFDLAKQILGGLLMVLLIFWVLRRKEIELPFGYIIRKDREIQVFIAFAFCFGFSIGTSYMGLSSALGAFVAGMLVASARETAWVSTNLIAFRTIFVALFFVSVGMLMDFGFILEHWGLVVLLVSLVFLTNNLINALIIRFLGEKWSDSFYIGAVLAQIGEFSFVLGATAYLGGLIDERMYKLVITTISISLILSPFWMALIKKLAYFKRKSLVFSN